MHSHQSLLGGVVPAQTDIAGIDARECRLACLAVGSVLRNKLKHGQCVGVGTVVHQSASLVKAQTRQRIRHLLVVRTALVETCKQSVGCALVAHTLVDDVCLVQQVGCVAPALARLTYVVEGVLVVAARHRGVEQIVERLVALRLFEHLAVQHVRVLVGLHTCGVQLQGVEEARQLAAVVALHTQLDESHSLGISVFFCQDARLLYHKG